MEPAAIVFLATASATGALHALIPDHWLPFVLMGRSRRWSLWKTLALASAGGLVHVLLAVGLGLLIVTLGHRGAEAAARRIGETLEILSSLGLSAFGFLYGAASWRRERRYHPARGGAGDPAAVSAQDHPHHHGHLLERWFVGEGSGWSLVMVIGLSPCAVAFPILLAGAVSLGISGVLLVAAGFGLATMITTLGITLVASLSTRKIDFPFLTRFGDLISGVLIGVVGASLFAWEVSGW